ncbi:MAG: 50S ribosomal protein L13 [Verrucomicrobia bacterium]|jgi:large subunit ribosomal protein L13|nr:50S ribosomal protein L13 [Verrucomicrobiota bacterium]
MRTISAKAKDVARRWYLIDADKQVVGRVAVKAADIIRGKNKPIFTPHVDTGDHVIVINAAKAVFTGKKETAKSYMSYSGYIGGHKSETVQARRARRPELLIQSAVKGMVMHNRLGRTILKKLFVYGGAEHPHTAQQPEKISVR